MLIINDKISIPLSEIDISAVRSEGPGGQHVNKTSSAAHLKFDIESSSLPQWVKTKILNLKDNHITSSGKIIIKAQETRSLVRNREEALKRFKEIILKSLVVVKKRRKTKPTKNSIEKRLETKKNRSKTKENRKKVDF
jgi:ribosome-associated protein